MNCPRCSTPIVQPATGRRRKHCSNPCKQAAYRQRRAGGLSDTELVSRSETPVLARGDRSQPAKAVLEPFIAAGLVERCGPTWKQVANPAISIAWDTRVGDPLPGYAKVLYRGLEEYLDGDPLDGGSLRCPPGPATGSSRAVRELIAA